MAEFKEPKELRGLTQGGVTTSDRPRPDVVAGWEFKNSDIDNAEMAGLVPFVQLFGLYSEQEIQKLLSNDPDWSANAITAVYVGEDGEQSLNDVSQKKGSAGADFDMGLGAIRTIADDQADHINSKLRSKFIDINIQDETHRDSEQYTPGILLATNKAQAGNEAYEYYEGTGTPKDSGGVGISDLSIETGTKEFMNRRYKMRLTVTNPQELNEEAEYLKLTSLQSQFLIIHGWSSPNSLHGWPGDPPPILEPSSRQFPNGRLQVDLNQDNTAGAWGAAVVATTMFDFAFNEVGQLEASFTFMPREISFLATYRVPTVADVMKKFLGTGEKSTPTDPNNPDTAPNVFAGLSTGLGTSMGLGKSLADVIFDEQTGYGTKNKTIMGLFDKIEDGTGTNVTSAINNWAESDSEWSGNSESLMERQKEREGRFRFPYAGPGIRTYSSQRRQIIDEERIDDIDPTNNEAPEDPMALRPGYKWITESKSRVAYYYLGWVLEAVRFSMFDLNQQKARRGETPFNVRFKYMQVPEKSQSTFNLAFQDTLRSGMVPNAKNYIQEAVKFLKTNCFPSFRLYNPMEQELGIYDNRYQLRPMTVADLSLLQTGAAYQVLGNYNETVVNATQWLEENVDASINWNTANNSQKLRYLSMAVGLTDGHSPNAQGVAASIANWRQTLVIDENNFLRILDPIYEGQILYTYRAQTINSAEKAGEYFGHFPCRQPTGVEADTGRRTGGNQRNEVESIQRAAGWRQVVIYAEHGADTGAKMDRATMKLNLPVIDSGGGTANPEVQFFEDLGGVRPPGFSRSSDGKFIGDITYSQEYGLLMPAQNARYYSTEYLAAQRKWYNLHVSFLARKVEEIVGVRITEAMEQGKDLHYIGPEPIDLYWLTGKKYFTPAVQNNIYEEVPYFAQAPPILYSFNEIKDNAAELQFKNNSAIRTGLEKKINDAKAEKERIERLNSGNINIYGRNDSSSLGVNDFKIMEVQLALDSVDRTTTVNHRQLQQAEDNFAKVIRENSGIMGVVSFWDSRIKKEVIELYNKDIIDLQGTGGSTEGKPTLSARLAPKLLDTNYESETQWANLNAQIERKILTSAPSLEFSNLRPWSSTPGQMPEVGYYFLFNGVPGTGGDTGRKRGIRGMRGPTDESTYVRWNQLLKDGFAFDNYLESKFEHRIQRSVVTSYENVISSLTIDNVDQLGDIGFTKEDIDNNNWSDGVYLEYIFMNLVELSWRNKYFSGASMYVRMWDSDNSPEMRALSTARQNYYDYIISVRKKIKRYFENIDKLMAKTNEYTLSTAHVDSVILELQQQLDGINLAARLTNEEATQELSPFHGVIARDRPVILPKGGGRYVKLDTIVAQQWEQRFQKREVFGSNDIHNYGVTPGGIAHTDSSLPYWGWYQANAFNDPLNTTYMLAEKLGVLEIKGQPNFATWDGPREILNLEKLRDSGAGYFYGRAAEGDRDQPYNIIGDVLNNENEWINDQPNILIVKEKEGSISFPNISTDVRRINVGATEEEESVLGQSGWTERITTHPIQVKHLIRAGMVDFDLIKKVLKQKYRFEDVGYEFEKNVKTISGLWPLSFHWSYEDWLNDKWGLVATRITEPYYRVDEDLDFVEEAYRQSTEGMLPFEGRGNKVDEEYLNGLDPMKLLKVPQSSCIFGPLSDESKTNVMYPNNSGRRLAMNDHLPTIPREGVLKLVLRDDAERTSRKHDGHRASEWYAPQPKWMRAGYREAASMGLYNNEGRPAYNDEYPYGLPAELVNNSTQTAGYNPVPTATSLEDRDKNIMTPNAKNPFEGVVLFGDDTWSAHKPQSSIHYGIGIPGRTHRGSWRCGRGAGEGDHTGYVGGASAPRIHDILYSLPDEFQHGFFSSTKDADENFGGGAPLNSGLISFINEHLINLLHDGRRIGLNADKLNDPPDQTLHNYYTGFVYRRSRGVMGTEEKVGNRIRDVTYGDCFNEFIQRTQNTADFSNQSIENVAELPIKREVVDNLLNRRNQNMSLLQFCQQIMSPASIGLAGNVQIGVRNNNGLVEIFPASISYKGIVEDMFKNALDTNVRTADGRGAPVNQMMFDYKRKNSLIQTIDMSSKMDPAAFLTYQNSSDILKGRDYNVLKLLSIDGVAAEMSEFLSAIPKADDDSGGTYNGIVNVGADRKVRVNKVAFENIPSSVIDAFISQDPQRWAQITAMMQEQNNFTTELLAFYMRGVTLTVHGVTNLEPFNLINVKGVLPALEGVYIITNLTQRISPSDFQTIIEGKLLKRRRLFRGGGGKFI